MNKEKCLGYSFLKNKSSELYGYAPAYEGGGTEEFFESLEVYRSYYCVEHGADKSDFMGYCEKLEKEGFEKFSSKSAGENLFATYFDGENIVNVSFISYKDVDKYVTRDVSYVLISVDSVRNSSLPCKAEKFEKITDVTVSYVSILTVIVRLLDGRFLVIDSGVMDDTEKIYDFLCKNNVREGKPTVAAWMFSHAHGDHVGGFIGILKNHSDDVVVERVIHNFPGEELYMPNKNYMECIPNREGLYMTNRSNEIARLMKENMRGGIFTIAHAGQTFEFPGVSVEVLQTSENLYKKQMFDTNMSSVIYMLTMPAGKMLALGDAVDAAVKILRKIYSKNLACDIVVLAHHALNGGDYEMYYDTGAVGAIWTNYAEGIDERGLLNHYTNHFDASLVKYNFIVSKEERIITLYEGMSREEFEHYSPVRDIKKRAYTPCYEKRRSPANQLPLSILEEGFGDAPRYYGLGEETEKLFVDRDAKEFSVTVDGATAYEFEYYCNTLKRDGYRKSSDSNENGKLFASYSDPMNEVTVEYENNTLKIIAHKAGENVLVY